MNRRNLLTTVVASVMLPGAVKAEGISVTGTPSVQPDAELIAVCAEYRRIQWAFEAYYDTLPRGNIDDDDPAWAMLEPVPALVEQIVVLRATTAEGHLARGRALAFHYLPNHISLQDNPDEAFEDRAQAAMLRDLVTIERGPATPTAVSPVASERPEPVHPDAELLEACAAYHACEDSRLAANPDLVCNTPECDRHEALHEAITERADVMVGDLADMPAVTREGMQAKARAILLWDGGNALKGEPDDYSGDRLMASLLRDLLAGSAGA